MPARKVNVRQHQRRTKTKIASVRQHHRNIIQKPQKINLSKSKRENALQKFLDNQAELTQTSEQLELLKEKKKSLINKFPSFQGSYDKVFIIEGEVIKTSKKDETDANLKRAKIWNGMHKKFSYISDATFRTIDGKTYVIVDFRGDAIKNIPDFRLKDLSFKQLNQIFDQMIYASNELRYHILDVDNDGNIAIDKQKNAFIIDYGNAEKIPRNKSDRIYNVERIFTDMKRMMEFNKKISKNKQRLLLQKLKKLRGYKELPKASKEEAMDLDFD